jgi:6-phospho-beta-glucosidase
VSPGDAGRFPAPAAPASAPVLTLVGGGVSVAALVEVLATALRVECLDIRLVAQDFETLEVIARHCRGVLDGRPEWTVTACRTVPDAAAGADVIVLMIRVGGLSARRADEELSRRFGIPGDEGLGPGGIANAWRTLPVLDAMAAELRAAAPTATVLNLVSPLGLTTRVLLDHRVDTVGVCELPGVTEARLARALPDVELAYGGLNHLGWFWPRVGDAGSRLAPAVEAGLVDSAVLAEFGAIPLKYFYWLFDPDAADGLGIARPADRTADLIDLRDRALLELADAPGDPSPAVAARPTPWFSDGVVPILAAAFDGRPWQGYANVANGHLVTALPSEVVIETRAAIRGGRVVAEPLRDPFPPVVLDFVERVARAELLVHQSWRTGDEARLVDALVEGPHRFDASMARELVTTMTDRSTASADHVGVSG